MHNDQLEQRDYKYQDQDEEDKKTDTLKLW